MLPRIHEWGRAAFVYLWSAATTSDFKVDKALAVCCSPPGSAAKYSILRRLQQVRCFPTVTRIANPPLFEVLLPLGEMHVRRWLILLWFLHLFWVYYVYTDQRKLCMHCDLPFVRRFDDWHFDSVDAG